MAGLLDTALGTIQQRLQQLQQWGAQYYRQEITPETIRNAPGGQNSAARRAASTIETANSVDPAKAGEWLSRNAERLAWAIGAVLLVGIGLYALARKA